MEPKDVNFSGNVISIKLMDESYIMCEDEKKHGIIVDIECRSISPQWPNPIYAIYYRKLLKAYGVGPVFVRQGCRIIGFLPIAVPSCGLPVLPLCVHYTGGLRYGAEKHVTLDMLQNSTPLPFEQMDIKEIRIGCMSVHWSVRGKNLAVLMVRYMVDWARKHDWNRMTARVMLDGELEAFYPTFSWWKRLGFIPIGNIRSFGPSDSPIDRSRAVDLVYDFNNIYS